MTDHIPVIVIQDRVAEAFSVSRVDILSPRRDRGSVIARHVAMLLCREFTTNSLPAIGRMFDDRDHTTVLHGIRAITRRIAADPALAHQVNRLRSAMAERVFIAWTKTVTGERGHAPNPLMRDTAEATLRVIAEPDSAFQYALVPERDIAAWMEIEHV